MARSLIHSSGAGSGVVLRHRAAAAACVFFTVDAAAAAAHCNCTPVGAAQIRPADGFLHTHCRNSSGFTKGFCNMVLYNCVLPFSYRELFSHHVHNHSLLRCRRMVRLEIQKELIISRRRPSLYSGALAFPGSRKFLRHRCIYQKRS